MWFIECDAPQVFQNKRIWLRPGTQFLIGRSRPKPGSPGQYIEHGSVSRKHLLITVDFVKDGDSAHLHAKSTLTILDSSKIGTTVDSINLQKNSKVLDKDAHTIKLGNYPELFHIKWVPMTFSFPSPSKAQKKATAISDFRAILEPLDIKCIDDFLARHTSHTVSLKRNTAFVLQALVNGRHIVMDPYLQEVAAAAKKNSPDEQSLLEADFDLNWPRELDFLPPPGKEPNPRPAHSEQFLPNSARSEIFAKYTFIFHDQGQYDTLMPVVTGGGGKVLLRQVNAGETDVRDMVDYIREVAGKKGDTSFDLSQQIGRTAAGGIVVLRVSSSDQQVPGYYDQLDLALRQRSIEQNEFLDAILDVDAAKLKQGVDVDALQSSVRPAEQPHDRRNHLQQASIVPSTAQRAEQSPARASAVQSQQEAEPESSAPGLAARRRAARQRTTQPTYRGFDDFKPEESLAQWQPPSPSESVPEPSQAPSADPIDAEYSVPSQSQRPGAESASTMRSQAQQSSRKRRGEPLEEMETTKDVVDGILKGATAMKKRKLEEDRRKAASRVADYEDLEMEEESPDQPVKKEASRPRKEKEMNVKALLKERNQVEEQARLRDEEVLREQFDGMDVTEIRNLAVIEEMDVMRKDPPPRANRGVDGPSDRWDDRWNGRKNFKKFRKQGTAGSTYERQRTRVIVPLEEVQRKAYGVGEDYWLESVEDTRRKEKEKRLLTQSQLRNNSQVNSGRKSQQSHRNGRDRDSAASSVTQAFDAEDDGNEMSVVHDDDDDDDDDDNDTTRFRRRIRNSRIQDAEAAETEEMYPEEIAGKPRDAEIEAAAHAHESSGVGSARKKTQTSGSRASTQSQTQGRKRGADASESAGAPAAKRVRGGNSRAAAINVDDDDDDGSDEEDALRFRRRTRK